MGLDLLDIAYRVEKRFGVRIDRAEGGFFLVTPGRMHAFVWNMLQGKPVRVPQLVPLHDQVLDALRNVIGRRFRSIGDLNRLMKPADRSVMWHRLGQALGCRLPALEVRRDEMEPAIPESCDAPWLLTWWIAEHQPDRIRWLEIDHASKTDQAERPWSEQDVGTACRNALPNPSDWSHTK